MRRQRRVAGAALLLGGALLATAVRAETPGTAIPPSGEPPRYTTRTLTPVANEGAFTARFWVPDLDRGFVPQGLTFHHGSVFLSGYVSTDREQNKGPCWLYRIAPGSGAVTGKLALPGVCGHAGGMARGPDGRIYVVDTRAVIEIRLATPATQGIGIVGTITPLKGRLLGSFAAGWDGAIWLGGYRREGTPETRLYRIALTQLVGQTLDERAATESVPLPDRAQGAAFDERGQLWITRSGSKLGELLRLDAKTGQIAARWNMPAGVEDLSFDAAGRLWTVSEAGSRRWSDWPTFYPLVLQIDVKRLP